MTLIEIQQNYIDRLLRAHHRMGKRSSGLAFGRSSRAARGEAIRELFRLGYDKEQIPVLIRDAYDMFLLERDAGRLATVRIRQP